MSCEQILTGYDACGKLSLNTGGLQKRIYLGLRSDLDEDHEDGIYSTGGSGDINSINFKAYKGFKKFIGVMAGNTLSVDAQRTEDGNPFYPASGSFKMFESTTDDKQFIENLAAAEDIFFVVETTGKQFVAVGIDYGVTLESALKSFGNVPTDPTGRLVVLSGDQPDIERYFSVESYAQTVVTLDSYVV